MFLCCFFSWHIYATYNVWNRISNSQENALKISRKRFSSASEICRWIFHECFHTPSGNIWMEQFYDFCGFSIVWRWLLLGRAWIFIHPCRHCWLLMRLNGVTSQLCELCKLIVIKIECASDEQPQFQFEQLWISALT